MFLLLERLEMETAYKLVGAITKDIFVKYFVVADARVGKHWIWKNYDIVTSTQGGNGLN